MGFRRERRVVALANVFEGELLSLRVYTRGESNRWRGVGEKFVTRLRGGEREIVYARVIRDGERAWEFEFGEGSERVRYCFRYTYESVEGDYI